MALSYLTGTVTQGSADAFAQSEIATALAGITNVAYRVREILFEFPSLGGANVANISLSITRRSKAAEPNIADRDVIAKFKRTQVVITSGIFGYPLTERLAFGEEDELLIVEDPLYFQVDSNATSASNTVYCRIGYERVSISALDRLSLLTQSLD